MRSRQRFEHNTYPKTYILEGGYEAFYQLYSDLCSPQSYVQMDAQRFRAECKQGLARLHQGF